jgi:hypothetical protein
MRRVALVIRLFTALTLAFLVAGATSYSTFAQDGEATPPPTDDSTVEQDALQGTLTVVVYTCSDGPEGVPGGLFLEGEFTPSENCAEEGSASIAIDGGTAEVVDSGAEYTLDEGVHTVVEDTLAASVDVSIAEQTPATVYAVFYTAPETAEAAIPGSVLITKHICPAEIQSQEEFDALGDFITKAQTCPVITLPGNAGPDGAVNGNDQESPLGFDFQVTFGETAVNIDSATFVPEQLCEADLGDINGDPNDNLCLDTSHYAYEGVSQGPVTITEVTPPDGYAFGALEFGPDSGDEATLVETVPAEGRIELDTTGDDSVVLHVYNFQKPAENRINIVSHQCPEEIDAEGYAALDGYLAKIATCPVVLRGDDDGPDGAISGGHRTFAFDVTGTDGVTQTVDGNATFVPEQVCEDEIGDVNGDPNDNACLDASMYQFDGVIQGAGVTVTATKSPKGYEYGGLEFDPESNDAAALINAGDDGVIQLDTTSDGEVTLHVFNVKSAAPEPTPTETTQPDATATAEPDATETAEPNPTEDAQPTPSADQSTVGSAQVIKLFCYSDVEETVITALAPGEEATSDQMGDGSCVSGSADFLITLFGTDEQPSFNVGDDGVETIADLPATDSGTGPHSLTEIYSDVSANFDVQPGTTTRIIVLNYLVEVEPDITGEDDAAFVDDGGDEALVDPASDINDETTIESGADLAETGIGPKNGSVNGEMILMLAAMSVFILAGASFTRRRVA